MKAKVISIVMLFLMTFVLSNASAQNDRSEQGTVPGFGIKAGINISNLYDTKGDDFSNSSKIGFAGGVFLSIPIGKYLGFQPELLYSQKGYKGSGSISLIDYEYTRNVDYFDIPLLLQIKPSPNFVLVAGPMYSFLLHKKVNFDSGNISLEQQTEIKNNNIRKNTLGVTGGIDIYARPIVISGRVGWDLQHNNGDGTSTDPRFKNVWIQTTIGLTF